MSTTNQTNLPVVDPLPDQVMGPIHPGQTFTLDPKVIPYMNPKHLAQFQQMMAAQQATAAAKPAPKPQYEGMMSTRVAVPIQSVRWGGGRLEMTVGAPDAKYGPPKVDFTLVLPGREAIDFSLHPVDLDSLVSQRTMDKLAK